LAFSVSFSYLLTCSIFLFFSIFCSGAQADFARTVQVGQVPLKRL